MMINKIFVKFTEQDIINLNKLLRMLYNDEGNTEDKYSEIHRLGLMNFWSKLLNLGNRVEDYCSDKVKDEHNN